MSFLKKFFLLMCIWLGFNQTIHAFSLQSLKQTFYSSVQDRSIIMPLVGVAAVGLFGFLLYKSFTAKKISVPVNQISVLPQKFDATCGYHSLKNALLAVSMHNLKRDWSILSESNDFLDKEYFDELLVKWKPSVENDRKKNALKKRIQAKLKELITGAKHFETYKNQIDNMGKNLADYSIENESGLYHITYNLILDILRDINNKSKAEIITDIPKLKDFEEYYIAETELVDDIKAEFDSIDEWLEGDNIVKLIDTETNLESIKNTISVLDDVDQIKSLLENSSMVVNENGKDKKVFIPNPMRQKWQQTDCFHVFIVGTMSERYPANKGHWFVVVAEKRNDQTQCYVMDSLNNQDRTNDRRVQKIFNELNKK